MTAAAAAITCRLPPGACTAAPRLPPPHKTSHPGPDNDPHQVLFVSDNKLTRLPATFGQTRKMQASCLHVPALHMRSPHSHPLPLPAT